uniref:Uncharacterized protein n=1 Tax=Ananas comosus var. bracteatus TaxID=296719 RepID=A0A6V7QH76_ANACO|nr:unnamed protein product [Ananas comosus var. bracteatus]
MGCPSCTRTPPMAKSRHQYVPLMDGCSREAATLDPPSPPALSPRMPSRIERSRDFSQLWASYNSTHAPRALPWAEKSGEPGRAPLPFTPFGFDLFLAWDLSVDPSLFPFHCFSTIVKLGAWSWSIVEGRSWDFKS